MQGFRDRLLFGGNTRDQDGGRADRFAAAAAIIIVWDVVIHCRESKRKQKNRNKST